jgi:hypothetical protein
MARKISISLFLFFSIAILMIGGINRTQAILNKGNNQSGQNQSNHENSTAANRGIETESWVEPSGSEDKMFSQSDYAIYPVITGNISGISQKSIELFGENASRYCLDGRTLRFALEEGFVPSEGLPLAFSFFEDEEIKFLWIKDLNQDQIYFLRSPNGQPLWHGNR